MIAFLVLFIHRRQRHPLRRTRFFLSRAIFFGRPQSIPYRRHLELSYFAFVLCVLHVQKVRFAQQPVRRVPFGRILDDHVFEHVVGGPERLVHGVQADASSAYGGTVAAVQLVKYFRAVLSELAHQPGVRASQHSIDFVHLVALVLAVEQRPAGGHFVQNATRGPNVHFRAVPAGRQQAFRWPVPPRRHVRRVQLARRHSTRGPEIADFQ